MKQLLSVRFCNCKIIATIGILFFTHFIVNAQKEFDGGRGTHYWPEFSDAPNALYHHIADQVYADLDKRSQKVAGIHTLAEWQQRQQWVKKTLQEVIGSFPEKHR